jgi:hypothetical protein
MSRVRNDTPFNTLSIFNYVTGLGLFINPSIINHQLRHRIKPIHQSFNHQSSITLQD